MASETLFDKLQNQFNLSLPFVAYKKPKANKLNSFLQKTSKLVIVKDYTESGFVFAPFDDKDKAVLIPMDDSEEFTSDLVNIENPEFLEHEASISESDEARNQHIRLVEKAIKAISSGSFEKVVLSRKEDVSCDEAPLELFKRLLFTYPNAFVYLWFHPNVGLWLGATPETLVEVKGSRLITMALAGTQAYKETTEVEWGEKEKQEQQFVTDFIAESLTSVSDKVAISPVQTVQAGNLLHLRTQISATLKNGSGGLKDILKQLHPTPAVCGLPKKVAKEFILETENYNREFYTGFLGELNLKQKITRNTNRRNVENNAYGRVQLTSDLYVNLRCMQLIDDKAYLYIGGGITVDSDPEKEWEETQHKAKIMKKVL
ncbi:chorismate-binding protein [Mangrovimonas aestuarii]|uniref:chorismate-binding protein n=1 Tax=Mangrovimonas aestuarii TaxID=3018443 RepID=UPI002378F159|nr:chorismate-binding protein [Mangrovimonas aestuarii]